MRANICVKICRLNLNNITVCCSVVDSLGICSNFATSIIITTCIVVTTAVTCARDNNALYWQLDNRACESSNLNCTCSAIVIGQSYCHTAWQGLLRDDKVEICRSIRQLHTITKVESNLTNALLFGKRAVCNERECVIDIVNGYPTCNLHIIIATKGHLHHLLLARNLQVESATDIFKGKFIALTRCNQQSMNIRIALNSGDCDIEILLGCNNRIVITIRVSHHHTIEFFYTLNNSLFNKGTYTLINLINLPKRVAAIIVKYRHLITIAPRHLIHLQIRELLKGEVNHIIRM